MPTPYMTEPALLQSLTGQQYIVLRPVGTVADCYRREQSAVLDQLPDGIPHPHTGHVTLRGFFEPERVPSLRDTIATWARSLSAIDLRVVAIDGFPPPFSVFIARLERTPSLTATYESLTELLHATDFLRVGELALDDWVFHLSLAYANALEEPAWDRTLDVIGREMTPNPYETVSSLDFVWYDSAGEHIETMPLGRP
jgi:hypothetical protein